MRNLPTPIVEKVYRLLQSKLGASSDYYEREAFIYHYTLVKSAPEEHRLVCGDGAERIFYCNSKKEMWVCGPGTELVNSILKQIHKEIAISRELGEFTITVT